MNHTRQVRKWMREYGASDAKLGKPISAYDIPIGRHTEALRAAYEIGYREAKKEAVS